MSLVHERLEQIVMSNSKHTSGKLSFRGWYKLNEFPSLHFENSSPEPTPFLKSLQTTVKTSFMKLGSNLYDRMGDGRGRKY